MRSLMFLLVLVLFCSVLMTSSAPLSTNVANCCLGFSTVKIPVKLVKSYYWTSSECPRRAIVFQTLAGREICVDPEITWVNGHVDKVDKRTTSAASANTTTTTTTTAAAKTKTSSAASTATTAKTQRPTV